VSLLNSKEALKNIKGAVELYIEDLRESGEPIPEEVSRLSFSNMQNLIIAMS